MLSVVQLLLQLLLIIRKQLGLLTVLKPIMLSSNRQEIKHHLVIINNMVNNNTVNNNMVNNNMVNNVVVLRVNKRSYFNSLCMHHYIKKNILVSFFSFPFSLLNQNKYFLQTYLFLLIISMYKTCIKFHSCMITSTCLTC